MSAYHDRSPSKVNPVRRLVVLMSVFALAAVACSSGDAVVATVNGTEITLAEVEDLRIRDDVVAREGTSQEAGFNDDLFQLIREEVLRQAGERIGLAPDQTAIDAFYNQYVADIEEEEPYEEFLEARGVTEETIRHVAFQRVYFPALQAKLLEDGGPLAAGVRSAYDELSTADTNLICTRHILVETEEESQGVIDRLEAGEEFGALAAELSLDGSGTNGGDIGCVTEAVMVASFAESYAETALSAPIGEVTEPFESQFGFHVMIVDSRQTQTFEEMRAQFEQQVINEWYLDTMGSADVVVTERYGQWQTEPDFGVVSSG